MTPPRRVGLLLVAAIFVSACQSTVRNGVEIAMDELAVAPSEVAGGAAAPSTPGSTPTGVAPTDAPVPGSTSDPVEAPTVAGPAGPAGQPVTPGGPAPTSPTGPGDPSTPGSPGEPAPTEPPGRDWSGLAMGPGVDEDTITIGIHASSDLTAAFSALGANARAVDEVDLSQALIDWFNERGGIAGRQIVPVVHETNPASGTFAAQAQAACATFTEDNQVFAVMSSAVGGDDSMLACLAPKDTPLIEGNLWLFDQPYYDENPGLLYQPARMLGDRWVRTYVDGLDDIGYLADGRDGLGLIRFDHPAFTRMSDNVFKPRLAELGFELQDEIVVASPKGVSDFGAMANELNSAVLRLQANDVTHLMFLENNGIMAFFFFDQAESQGYRPRYGLNSMDIMGTMERNADPEQLANSVGVSWMPSSDLNEGRELGGNPQFDLCRQIAAGAGLGEVGYYIQPRCDAFFFLARALEGAPALTKDGLRVGVEALGASWVGGVAPTGRTSFGPGRYDGVNAWVPVGYDSSCSCFRHTGAVRGLP